MDDGSGEINFSYIREMFVRRPATWGSLVSLSAPPAPARTHWWTLIPLVTFVGSFAQFLCFDLLHCVKDTPHMSMWWYPFKFELHRIYEIWLRYQEAEPQQNSTSLILLSKWNHLKAERNHLWFLGTDVLTAVTAKASVFWNIKSWGPAEFSG
jgi:hypothetical protein